LQDCGCAGRGGAGTLGSSQSNEQESTMKPSLAGLRAAAAATLVSAGALAAVPAHASGTVLGAVIGGGAGAVIGQSIGGRDGAIIGGAIGAAAGVAAAQSQRGYGPVGQAVVYPAPVYAPPPVYAPAVVYQAPPVVYRAPPRVVYRPVRYEPRPYYHGAPGWRPGYGYRH